MPPGDRRDLFGNATVSVTTRATSGNQPLDRGRSTPRRRGKSQGRREDARQARYRSLLEDLESAYQDLQRYLPQANEEDLREVLGEFLDELIRVTRADSRLLEHPIVRGWVRNATAWGWRGFLKKLPHDEEQSAHERELGARRRALRKDELTLVAAVDDLRWTPLVSEIIPARRKATTVEEVGALRAMNAIRLDSFRWKAEMKAAATEQKPIRSMLSIYRLLKQNPNTRHQLKRKGSDSLMSYQAFHEQVADGLGKGGQIGTLRL